MPVSAQFFFFVKRAHLLSCFFERFSQNIRTASISYFPENVEFIITNQAATTSPVKLSEYKIHDNPPGINGWLVEGRVYYDAFVLENKKSAIYVFKTAE